MKNRIEFPLKRAENEKKNLQNANGFWRSKKNKNTDSQ